MGRRGTRNRSLTQPSRRADEIWSLIACNAMTLVRRILLHLNIFITFNFINKKKCFAIRFLLALRSRHSTTMLRNAINLTTEIYCSCPVSFCHHRNWFSWYFFSKISLTLPFWFLSTPAGKKRYHSHKIKLKLCGSINNLWTIKIINSKWIKFKFLFRLQGRKQKFLVPSGYI